MKSTEAYKLWVCMVLPMWLTGVPRLAYAKTQKPDTSPVIDSEFWKTWGDGKAEIATYDLRYPRYGDIRSGTAVAIFVTETFSDQARVKADPGIHPESDLIPVIKLNLVADFQTGIYDYNTMTSSFVALQSKGTARRGFPMKISFSAQEWCGHVYHQLLFHPGHITETLHSYFDQEADKNAKIPWQEDAISEDVLLLWARGLVAPVLSKGESTERLLLPSLMHSRLNHSPLRLAKATLSRSAEVRTTDTPAGSFQTDVFTVQSHGGERRTYFVDTQKPNAIVKWESSTGETAQLVARRRVAYWQLNSEAGAEQLKSIGLSARTPRTP